MDFFRSQDLARRKTGWLVFYFVLAVIGVVLAVSVVAAIAVNVAGDQKPGLTVPVVAAAAGAALVVIFLGTTFKTAQLSSGGKVVAESLNGRALNPSTIDPLERRLLNVVEEMAIASGIPAPPVYVLDDEDDINAFAAGFAPGDAVIGVTRGTLEQLPRDELQGVVAHEFSHILNGDMRLNLRLMGLVHGILVIALAGSFLLRILGNSSRVSTSRSGNKKDGGGIALALLILGVGLYIIGWIGVVFGRMIKAAASRQREYLADASAVQFTRNPLGIAGALKRIGGYGGSQLKSPNAEVASHMYFGDGIGFAASSPFATHPPLSDRILRLDPSFKGEMIEGPPAVPPGIEEANHPELVTSSLRASTPVPTEHAVSSVGDPQRRHFAYAAEVLAAIPAALHHAANEPFSARAVVVALLFADHAEDRQEAFVHWRENADSKLAEETRRLLPLLLDLPPELRLPVLEVSLPALRQMSIGQRKAFKRDVDLIVEFDQRITLFEYVVQRTLLRRLLGEPKMIPTNVNRMDFVSGSAARLLGALAYLGTPKGPKFAFDVGAARLRVAVSLPPAEECGLSDVDRALEVLHGLTPKLKRRLLDACAACIGADGTITVKEAELFRAVADSLDCPVPPLVAG
jgi:Zn-dependent protease with chaperone function